ncbi:hypothetical protein Avbf_05427 [Armadillidium vulgare]|nr:hypothetical protein Avbf_05427 [Armadillidium vulgare]
MKTFSAEKSNPSYFLLQYVFLLLRLHPIGNYLNDLDSLEINFRRGSQTCLSVFRKLKLSRIPFIASEIKYMRDCTMALWFASPYLMVLKTKKLIWTSRI